jgi:hypothetical protein
MISTQASVRDESKNLNSGVSLSGKASKPVRDDRMCRLAERRDRLGREGRRSNFVDNPEFLVYHWSGTG